MPRREKWGILASILRALLEEEPRGAQGRITTVAARANLPHDRLLLLLDDLASAGLIERQSEQLPRVTSKGANFIREYDSWIDTLERFGLE